MYGDRTHVRPSSASVRMFFALHDKSNCRVASKVPRENSSARLVISVAGGSGIADAQASQRGRFEILHESQEAIKQLRGALKNHSRPGATIHLVHHPVFSP